MHALSSAYGHHLAEGRWLRDQTLLDDYTLFWYRHGGDLHKYSQWSTDALYKRSLVNLDKKFIVDLLDDLIDDYKKSEGYRINCQMGFLLRKFYHIKFLLNDTSCLLNRALFKKISIQESNRCLYSLPIIYFLFKLVP